MGGRFKEEIILQHMFSGNRKLFLNILEFSDDAQFINNIVMTIENLLRNSFKSFRWKLKVLLST